MSAECVGEDDEVYSSSCASLQEPTCEEGAEIPCTSNGNDNGEVGAEMKNGDVLTLNQVKIAQKLQVISDG